MNQQQISINKLHALYIPGTVVGEDGEVAAPSNVSPGIAGMVGAIGAKMMSYGYMPTQRLHNALLGLDEAALISLHDEAIPVLQQNKGAHVRHRPMYVNFPTQVMEMDEMELFLNAIAHYWTGGQYKPDYPELPRGLAFETTKWVDISVAGDSEFEGVFTSIVGSQDSISDDDRAIIRHFMTRSGQKPAIPATIPFKENLCVVAALAMDYSDDPAVILRGLLKTSTDILRVITYRNEGDISLAANTRYRSMPRRERRMWVGLLEEVIRAEDIHRHRSKWVRLFHTLHVGEYRRAERVNIIAKKIRNNETIRTFNGRVELAIKRGDIDEAINVLSNRPGEFARRLDHLFRSFPDDGDRRVIDGFLKVANDVPTRILSQVMGHLQTRMQTAGGENITSARVVFPKGQTAKARILPALPGINQAHVKQLYGGLQARLVERFGALSALGKVYIDPALHECPLPTGQRSASPNAMTVARGTRLPFGDDTKTTLRFFIYWVGRDIDLSATLHDEEFNMIERIGYTNLRSSKFESCHSGDITRAPNGASEFIDITIDPAAAAGGRYVVMNVLVFSGPTFREHSQCFAGWMTRSKPGLNPASKQQTMALAFKINMNDGILPISFQSIGRMLVGLPFKINKH